MKKCCKCKIVKNRSDFHKNKYTKDGLASACKVCRNIEEGNRYAKNKNKILKRLKKSYKKDRRKILKRNKKWRKNNPEKAKESRNLSHKKWYSKDNNKIKKKKYAKKNVVKIRKYNNKYQSDRSEIDINFKLSRKLRTRLNMALRKNAKRGSAIKDLGCSIDFLKQYLESLFKPGMNWENYSRKGWHIDHILPLSSFDLSNREDFFKANHYTNLQPLWAIDNIKKGNKVLK